MKESAPGVCGECGKPAGVYVTWVKAGQAHTAAFCAEHADSAGVLDPFGYALLESAELAISQTADGSPRCPVCDCSQRDFERQGRFGCPACYGSFAGLLPPLLGRMHRGVQHRGKFPQGRMDPVVVRHRIAKLQVELNDAVRTEQFEGAAQTRDAIAALKAKLLEPASNVLSGLDATPPSGG